MNASPRTMKPPSPTRHSKPKMKNDAWRSLSDLCMIFRSDLLNRRRQGSFGIPTSNNSMPYNMVIDIKESGPLRNRLGDFASCIKMIISFVICLFSMSSPAAVFRIITLSIVDSIYRLIKRWPLAHIFKEINKLSPSFTNTNSTFGVCFGVVCFCLTPPNHASPAFIGRASPHTMLFADNFTSSRTYFLLEAPARLASALFKGAAYD